MSNIRIETTRDGSHTLYSDTLGSYYHNPNGAVDESLLIYFERSGILEALRNHRPVSVMEVGFGTGLDLLLLADQAEQLNSRSDIQFTSVEAYPISVAFANQLNYARFVNHPDLFDEVLTFFPILNEGGSSVIIKQVGRVQARVFGCLFDDFDPGEHHPFTHILHDPFDPLVNPELWKPSVFQRLKQWSAPDAVLVTYAASSAARAGLAVGGWLMARAPGALGKREMTVASLSEEKLAGMKRVKEQRLIERYKGGELGGQK